MVSVRSRELKHSEEGRDHNADKREEGPRLREGLVMTQKGGCLLC